MTINEIQVAIDSYIIEYTEYLTLDYNQYRGGFVLLGNEGGC